MPPRRLMPAQRPSFNGQGLGGRMQEVPPDIAAWQTTESRPVREDRVALQGGISLSPWYVEPLASSIFFNDTSATIALAAGPGTSVTFLDAAGANYGFTVPNNNVGVIRGVTIFIDAPTAATLVDFAVRVNGNAATGFAKLSSFPRVATNISLGFSAAIRLNPNDVVTCTASNRSAAGPWTIAVQLTAWTTPKFDIERIFGEIGNY